MRKLLFLTMLASIGASSTAWAQFGELWFSAGQSLISNNGLGTTAQIGGSKDDIQLLNGFRFALRMTFNGQGRTGHEITYAYSRTHLHIAGSSPDFGMAYHTVMYNYLYYFTEEGAKVRPFVTGGAGFINYVPPGSSGASGGGSRKFGVNYGAGVKVRLAENWSMRFDFRQYATPKPIFFAPQELREGWIRPNEFSAGVGFVF